MTESHKGPKDQDPKHREADNEQQFRITVMLSLMLVLKCLWEKGLNNGHNMGPDPDLNMVDPSYPRLLHKDKRLKSIQSWTRMMNGLQS